MNFSVIADTIISLIQSFGVNYIYIHIDFFVDLQVSI